MKKIILFTSLLVFSLLGAGQSVIKQGKSIPAFLQSYAAEDTLLIDSIYQYNYYSPKDSDLVLRQYFGYNQWGIRNSQISYNSCKVCSSPGTSKSESVFDESGNCIMVTSYDWDKVVKNWIATKKVDQTYINNKVVSAVSYTWNKSSGQWVKMLKYEFSYGENDQRYTEISYSWDQTQNNWIYDLKCEKQFDSEGNATGVAYYTYDSKASEWKGSNKEETIYENGNITSRLKSSWDNVSKQWVNSEKEEHYSNEAGKDTLVIGYTWNLLDNKWLNVSKSRSEYDGNGNVLSVTTGYYDSANRMAGGSMYEYQYDEWNNQVMYVSYDWDVITKQWLGSFKAESIYDHSMLIDEVTSTWAEYQNDWVYTNRSSRVYDSNGVLLGFSIYTWNLANETWTIKNKSQYFYTLRHFTNTIDANRFSEFKVFPNPATNFINITAPTANSERYLLKITDLQGSVLMAKEIEFTGNFRLDLNGLKGGIYFISLEFKGEKFFRQIVKADFQ